MTSILEIARPSFFTYELYYRVTKTQAFDVGSHKSRTVRKKYELLDIFGPFLSLPVLDYHTTNPAIPAFTSLDNSLLSQNERRKTFRDYIL